MNLSLAVARKTKRLKYWEEQFQHLTQNKDFILEKLNTYNLLISKLARAKEKPDLLECENRLCTLERELSGLFESRRLLTSDLGTPAVKDTY